MPSNPHSAPTSTSAAVQRRIAQAHERLGLGADAYPEDTATAVRPLISESWRRSLSYLNSPAAALALSDADLAAYRNDHPLSAVMPMINQLLVEPGRDNNLLVAVGDEHGRLLWIDGDNAMRRRAEGIAFVAGADWSERVIGTSAPGTALAVDASVQVAGAEHFDRSVHAFSCTAVPVHDPDTGAVLGVVDITGGPDAVAPYTLSLVQAAVAAAEAHLRIQRLQSRLPATIANNMATGHRNGLQVLGTDYGILHWNGITVRLNGRHAEILLLLALHPDGLTADELALLLYPEAPPVSTVRAEMLRLRRLVQAQAPSLVPSSRPYQLPSALAVDAEQVLKNLRRGAHRRALNHYPGPVLTRSEAPGIVNYRERVAAELRECVMSDAGCEALMQYLALPEAADDADAWLAALRVLPARSPRRAGVVAHLQQLQYLDSTHAEPEHGHATSAQRDPS